MSRKALKDLPLQEITLRKYEEPTAFNDRELVKKFCLSLGLLQPGDSRDIIVDIFLILIKARKDKQILPINAILERLSNKEGASPSNVRRQLRRLRSLKLVEKIPEGYRITESSKIEPLFDNYIIQFLVNPSLERIRNYIKIIDEL